MKIKLPSIVSLVAFLVFASALPLNAKTADSRQKSRVSEEVLSEKVRSADQTLKEFLENPDGLPRDMLKEAKAIVIFTTAVRAGFIITGQYAHGVALAKNASGVWSAPAFFRMTGMGVGFQVGGESGDMILIVRNQEGVDALLKHRFTMGADVDATAGSVGRDLKAGGNSKVGGILTYARTKGLFAGVSLDGSVIKQDMPANEVYYRQPLDARQILIDRKVTVPGSASGLVQTLEKYSS